LLERGKVREAISNLKGCYLSAMSTGHDTTLHRLTDPIASPTRLSQSVVQAGQLLGLYRAEVARLLGFQCESIGALCEGRIELIPDTLAWEQALLFIRLYQGLIDRFEGEGPRIYHWLRTDNRELGNSPFLLMIDEGELARVVAFVEQQMV